MHIPIPEHRDSTIRYNSNTKQYDYTYFVRNAWYNNFEWLEPRTYEKHEFAILKVDIDFKLFIRKLPCFFQGHHGRKSICLEILRLRDPSLFLQIRGQELHTKWIRYKDIPYKQKIISLISDIIINQ